MSSPDATALPTDRVLPAAGSAILFARMQRRAARADAPA